MSISLRAERTRRLCFDAMLVAGAMMLSYLEVLLPLDVWIPLPGFRLGLANLAIMLAFFLLSPIDAAIISALRILLMGILFGSVTSLWFSFMGGLLAFLTLAAVARFGRGFSFIGISVLCAAAHNLGQILAAVAMFGSSLIVSYLPFLLVAAVVFGGIVGSLLNLLFPKLQKIWGRGRAG